MMVEDGQTDTGRHRNRCQRNGQTETGRQISVSSGLENKCKKKRSVPLCVEKNGQGIASVISDTETASPITHSQRAEMN